MFSLSALKAKQDKPHPVHLQGQMEPLLPIPPKAPWAAVLGKDEDAHERRLCLLVLPVKHCVRGICPTHDTPTASHFSPYTPSHKSLLFRIYVSEVKFIWCETLAKSWSISFQVLHKSRWSDAPRRTDWICCTTQMYALLITLKLRGKTEF